MILGASKMPEPVLVRMDFNNCRFAKTKKMVTVYFTENTFGTLIKRLL